MNYGPENWVVPQIPQANTPEWLAWREERRLTTGFASEAAAVLNKGKFKPRTRRELYLKKHGKLSHTPYAPALAHGHKYEPIARRWAEERLGNDFWPVTHASECGRFVASPDGVSFDNLDLLEIKCPSSGLQGELWNSVVAGVVPEYYYWQLVQQAALSDAERVHFVVWAGPGENEQAVITLEAHGLRKAWYETLKPAWESFFEELLLSCFKVAKKATMKQESEPDETNDEEFLTLAAELADLEEVYKDVAAKRDAVQAALKARAEALGGKQVTGGGYVVQKRSRSGSVDYKLLFAKHSIDKAEVEAFRTPGTTYWDVRAKK